MSQHPIEQPIEGLEARLRQAGRDLVYPPTPQLAGAGPSQRAARPVRARRLAWGAIMALLLGMVVLLAVPPVRAAVLDLLRLGAVRIFLVEPTPSATRPAATARPTATPLASLLDLAGETSLAEARARVGFPLRWPAKLEVPERVFVQNNFGGPLVVLVWLEPGRPEQVRLSLHILGPNTAAGKSAPELVQETTVNGQPALWVVGAHFFELEDGNFDLRRLVEGNVLIWTEEALTYRLETRLSLEEAVELAESLR